MYLDECGFAPSQPVNYAWVRAGERKRIPYENPQGRRENVLAVLDVDSPVPSLHWVGYGGTFRGVHLARAFDELLDQPETSGRPLVIVLDNASSHHSHALRDALPSLTARGLTLFYLPPASPELNAIERVFRAIKHTYLPERRYTSQEALHDAVATAFATYEASLIAKASFHPGLAA
jgi:transposase InsO family protein